MGVKYSKWRSHSNIAIVKYWGKKGLQFPCNPSISFNLEGIFTETSIALLEKKETKDRELAFYFEGQEKPAFLPKINTFFDRMNYDWTKSYRIEIRSENNFPHGTGIASSASSMSSLALCATTIDFEFQAKEKNTPLFFQAASFAARMGSGSACRSLFPGFSIWGRHNKIPFSTDRHAMPLQDIHEVFQTICDAVLVVDKGEKEVSSSKGHALLEDHWYAERRYEQGFLNTERIYQILQSGDFALFGLIAEQEALALHAMMLTSHPGYLLMKQGTVELIDKIRTFRQNTNTPVYFTLDAGPNLHLLYPLSVAEKVKTWIEDELKPLCADEMVLYSKLGTGPVELATA
jgi:diphosphomevalonate decarboxylase